MVRSATLLPSLRGALATPQVDLLCFETIPCLKEAKAIAQLLEALRPGKPAWISFSCRDGTSTCHGEAFAEVGALVGLGVASWQGG